MFYNLIKAKKSVMESTQRSYNESIEACKVLSDKQDEQDSQIQGDLKVISTICDEMSTAELKG